MELQGVAREIWDSKYRFKAPDGTPIDQTISDTHTRIAVALAAVEEPGKRSAIETQFYDCLQDFSVLPAGRIIAGAGTGRNVTLMNCFVMGELRDSLGGIYDMLRDTALTMKEGGGTGTDFSPLRPQGALIRDLGVGASGPLTFMDDWDSMCRSIMSAGHRRGAMMGTLRIDHPDIEAFIEAKRTAGRMRNFNISVLVTDPFMEAVKNDADWALVFNRKLYKTVRARDLWDKIMRSTFDFADPGVIFIDRVNAANPLRAREWLHCTNPCGEQPLPPWGACCLGSINLSRMVDNPFTSAAALNVPKIIRVTHTLTRMLDNVIDATHYPLEQQRVEMMSKRRIGIGITGLANVLAMLSIRYSSKMAAALAREITATIAEAHAEASIKLGEEKGSFPLYDRTTYLGKFGAGAEHRRNSHGTSIAPTGTISLLAGNVSSGIEPIFDLTLKRRIRQPDDTYQEVVLRDYAYGLYRQMIEADQPVYEGAADVWETVENLTPAHHLAILTACTPNVDSSISKTINCPKSITFEDFKDVYMDAYTRGAKSCTTYRPNDITGSILSSDTKAKEEDKPVSNIVELTKPLSRPGELHGTTYRLKPPNATHALFITINDIDEGGRRRPFEIFINTKNLEHLAWSTALTRMISAIFRRGGDLSFVVDELAEVFDPLGGGYWQDQKHVPSLIAGIGGIIQQHLAALGTTVEQPAAKQSCPQCRSPMVNKEGCWSCTSCTHSKCG